MLESFKNNVGSQFGLYFRDEFLQLRPLVLDKLRVWGKPNYIGVRLTIEASYHFKEAFELRERW
jgi:hypothetical protein